MKHMRIVVMGPSGSGKSEVGIRLADALGVPFVDADDLHPPANVEKMAGGIPLDDTDRMPWLTVVGETLRDAPSLVVACSALARRYRDRILAVAPDVRFVELTVPAQELARRMASRSHFMPPALLGSQLAAWEPLAADEPGVCVENTGPLNDVVAAIEDALERQSLR
jgi:gluconokinase